jgi:hypothetical protein
MPVLETIDRILVISEAPPPMLICTDADPFEIDDPCPFNASGPHRFLAICGDVVCVHCAKVIWS